jgi:hypothetical protein
MSSDTQIDQPNRVKVERHWWALYLSSSSLLANPQGTIAMWFFTLFTPGARQAARSASSTNSYFY